MYKKFTLIELIVVVVILGILSEIIVPNISDVKRKGITTALTSNIRNLQTISDLYALENGDEVPTVVTPSILRPEPINFETLYPKYEVNLPKVPNNKYWIDVTGTVWGSVDDSPKGYRQIGTEIAWDAVPKATGYQVFEIVGYKSLASGAFKSQRIQYKPVGDVIKETSLKDTDPDKAYAVSSVDIYGHLSAPIGTGEYTPYPEELESGNKGQSGSQNRPPIARISVSPKTTVDSATTLTWGSEESYDLDGDEIVDAEWDNKQDSYTEGTHSVKLRVKDSAGNWSEWASINIYVEKVGTAPTAVITYSPTTNVDSNTAITFNSTASFDNDGDAIISSEWQADEGTITQTPPDGKYAAGNHVFKLRVRDARNTWSEWTSKTIAVAQANRAPTAVIQVTPNPAYSTSTVTFSYAYSDLDNDPIGSVEWKLDSGNTTSYLAPQVLTEGSHTVKLRVKDNKGNWSDWYEETFTVGLNHAPNAPSLSMVTAKGIQNEDVVFSFNHNGDPDGDEIVKAEWLTTNNSKSGTVNAGSGTFTTRFDSKGNWGVQVRVQDSKGAWSNWTSITTSYIEPAVFAAGSCNIRSSDSYWWYSGTSVNYGFHLTSWSSTWSTDYTIKFTISGTQKTYAQDGNNNLFWIYSQSVTGAYIGVTITDPRSSNKVLCTGGGYVSQQGMP